MKKCFLILGLLFCLVSCGNASFSSFEGELNTSSFPSFTGEGYKRVSSFEPIKTLDEEIDTNLLSNVLNNNSFKVIPSIGEQHLLVIPVKFSSKTENEEEKIDLIRKAFFGNKENNQYYSVSEYYYLSSLGKFLLKGDVTPFYKTNYSLDSLNAVYGSSATKSTLSSIYKEAVSWVKETNPSLYEAYYSSYGESIPTYFIYDAPYNGMDSGQSDRRSLMWAFTINDPSPICWSSYYMGYPKQGKMDAHTFIHETGHLLGLSDYYDTSSLTANKISPLGRMDMMDCSIGDHNCFSKMLLGWSSPYFVTSSCNIRLHQASGNNECIIIPIDSSLNQYGRYILLELYSPTYLNYDDAYNRSDSLRLFDKPGIRAYLVDSRLSVYEGISNLGTINESISTKNRRISFTNDNSSSSFLIQNIDKSINSTSLPPFYVASTENKVSEENGNSLRFSSTLFYQYEGIPSSFSGITGLEYSFIITKLTSGYAEITITKS